jgi:hypothetical protein
LRAARSALRRAAAYSRRLVTKPTGLQQSRRAHLLDRPPGRRVLRLRCARRSFPHGGRGCRRRGRCDARVRLYGRRGPRGRGHRRWCNRRRGWSRHRRGGARASCGRGRRLH